MEKAGDDLYRARRRLWGVTFTILGAMTLALVYLASAEAGGTPRPLFLPSRRTLGIGLGASLIVFSLYVFDSERKLRALSDRLIEERLASARLQAAQVEQRDFVSMAAHELRAPLTAIKGFTRTLLMRFDQLDSRQRSSYLTMVNEQSNRLARLVDDLMSASRIDAGRVRLQRVVVDPVEVVQGIVQEFAGKWGGRRIEIDARTPSSAVLADRHKLEEIVINLIDNAVKYSPESEPVTVSVEARDGDVVIGVRDRGDGLSSEEIGELFRKFHRLPAAVATDVPGTGLGLYIVRGLVEAHGGRVDVHSAPGEGSTFSVTLPVATDEEPDREIDVRAAV